MNLLINYADGCCYNSRKNNSLSGINVGFDSVIQYNKSDIDERFFNKNRDILSRSRGAGYWLWKPYCILKTLNAVSDGDVIFYADAGSTFVKFPDMVMESVNTTSLGVVGFQLAGHHKEIEYTKKETLDYFDFTEQMAQSDQHMASFICVRKCRSSIDHIKDYLFLCENPKLILDPEIDDIQYADFIEHRHDQSIWSLLMKTRDVTVLQDPCQWGLHHNQTTADDVFIEHHRVKT